MKGVAYQRMSDPQNLPWSILTISKRNTLQTLQAAQAMLQTHPLAVVVAATATKIRLQIHLLASEIFPTSPNWAPTPFESTL